MTQTFKNNKIIKSIVMNINGNILNKILILSLKVM